MKRRKTIRSEKETQLVATKKYLDGPVKLKEGHTHFTS